MKKRNLWLFSGMICAALALCGVPAVYAEAADTAQYGARILYKSSYDNYFRVIASHGGIVTYTEGKSFVAAECDEEGSQTREDVYYFKLPKRGEMEIRVKFEDGSETVLKVIAEKAVREVYQSTYSCKAEYDPGASGYEYGRINATVEKSGYDDIEKARYNNEGAAEEANTDEIAYDFVARVDDRTYTKYDYYWYYYYGFDNEDDWWYYYNDNEYTSWLDKDIDAEYYKLYDHSKDEYNYYTSYCHWTYDYYDGKYMMILVDENGNKICTYDGSGDKVLVDENCNKVTDKNGRYIYMDWEYKRYVLDGNGNKIFVDKNGNEIHEDEKGNKYILDGSGSKIFVDSYGNEMIVGGTNYYKLKEEVELHTGSCVPIYIHYLKGEAKDDVEMMNDFLKPLFREGATVVVGPGGEGYSYKKVSYESSNDGKELRFHKLTRIYKNKVKTAKVKIPKQKNPPKAKLNAVKGTIGTSSEMEIRFAAFDNGKLGAFDEWRKAEKNMSLGKVSGPAIASGGIIQVRYSTTDTLLYSKTQCIEIPTAPAIDIEKIVWEGVVTKGSITISDFDKKTKPYEYTLDNPDESPKWINVKDGKIVFKGKKSLTDSSVVYIREKGTNANAKKKVELKLPSTIAMVSVSGGAVSQENIKPYAKP